jgi:DTW domain-containing protein YfiP
MRWKKAGGQTIVNLRVVLLSGVWHEAYRMVMKNINKVYVPAYDIPSEKVLSIAA